MLRRMEPCSPRCFLYSSYGIMVAIILPISLSCIGIDESILLFVSHPLSCKLIYTVDIVSFTAPKRVVTYA